MRVSLKKPFAQVRFSYFQNLHREKPDLVTLAVATFVPEGCLTMVVVEAAGCKCATAEQLLPDLHSHLPPPTVSRSNGITLDPLSPVSLWARDLDSFGAGVNGDRGVWRLNRKLSPWSSFSSFSSSSPYSGLPVRSR